MSRPGTPRVELYIGSPDADVNRAEFERYLACRGDLDEAFGEPLTYDPMDGYKACRIYCARPQGGDISRISQQPEVKRWLLDTLERFRPAILQIRAQIEAPGTGGL